jgi:hypothetical protein
MRQSHSSATEISVQSLTTRSRNTGSDCGAGEDCIKSMRGVVGRDRLRTGNK